MIATIWMAEINELEKLIKSFKGQLPYLGKEIQPLFNTSDPIVAMLYARRSLEIIITELCEKELKRPRKTQPLKGIIDLLNSEGKVPSHIIASMSSLNSLSNYGAHPREFEPEQVKPVLNNLVIILKWYLKVKEINFSKESMQGVETFKITHENKTTFLLKRKNQMIPKSKSFVNFMIFCLIGIAVIITSFELYKHHVFGTVSNKNIKKITANPVAYEWYTRATYRISYEKEDLDSCAYFLKKAIESDTDFALAHAELSYVYSYLNYFIEPNRGYDELAYTEAETSLYINPDLAEGIFAKAFCSWNFENRFPHEKAIREFKKALELNPEIEEAHHWLGIVYNHVGLTDEAISELKKALEINPDNRLIAADMAGAYYFKGGINNLLKSVELFREVPDKFMKPLRKGFLIAAYAELGKFNEAEEILLKEPKKDSSNFFLQCASAVLLAKKGNKDAAYKKIEVCEKTNINFSHFHHGVYNLAIAYAELGEYQKSVEKLKWVADNGCPCYTQFKYDPMLQSLHRYPPYNELIKKLEVSWKHYKQIAQE